MPIQDHWESGKSIDLKFEFKKKCSMTSVQDMAKSALVWLLLLIASPVTAEGGDEELKVAISQKEDGSFIAALGSNVSAQQSTSCIFARGL